MNTYTYTIETDDSPENPYENWDNLMKLDTYDPRVLSYGTAARYYARLYGTAYGHESEIARDLKDAGAVILIDARPYTDSAGFAYCTKADIIREYGAYNPATSRKARRVMIAELETYKQWANGEVYGWVIKDQHGQHVDSCWGYYDYKCAEQEAKAAIKHLEAQERKRRTTPARLYPARPQRA